MRRLLSILFVLLLALPCWGAVWYVDGTAGNDTYDGTQSVVTPAIDTDGLGWTCTAACVLELGSQGDWDALKAEFDAGRRVLHLSADAAATTDNWYTIQSMDNTDNTAICGVIEEAGGDNITAEVAVDIIGTGPEATLLAAWVDAVTEGDVINVCSDLTSAGYHLLSNDTTNTSDRGVTIKSNVVNTRRTLTSTGGYAVWMDNPNALRTKAVTWQDIGMVTTAANTTAVVSLYNANSDRPLTFTRCYLENQSTAGSKRGIHCETAGGATSTRTLTLTNTTIKTDLRVAYLTDFETITVTGCTFSNYSAGGGSVLTILNTANAATSITIGGYSAGDANTFASGTSATGLIQFSAGKVSTLVVVGNTMTQGGNAWAIDTASATNAMLQSCDRLEISGNTIATAGNGIRVVCDDNTSPTYSPQRPSICDNTITMSSTGGTGIHLGAVTDSNEGTHDRPIYGAVIHRNTILGPASVSGNSHGILATRGAYYSSIDKCQVERTRWGIVSKGINTSATGCSVIAEQCYLWKGNTKFGLLRNCTAKALTHATYSYCLGLRQSAAGTIAAPPDDTTQIPYGLTAECNIFDASDGIYCISNEGDGDSGITVGSIGTILNRNLYVAGSGGMQYWDAAKADISACRTYWDGIAGFAQNDNDSDSATSANFFSTTDLRIRSGSPAEGTKVGTPSLTTWNDRGAWQALQSPGSLYLNPKPR